MLYFSSQPVVYETVEHEQISQLKNFKESCQNRGLYEGYDSLSSFKDKLNRQLQLKVNEHELFLNVSIGSSEDIAESKTNLPQLTSEARTLLKESSRDKHGSIIQLRHLGGTDIQTNGKNFIGSNERREVARWEAAINELVALDLVVARGHKGEIFEITSYGYQIADMIEM